MLLKTEDVKLKTEDSKIKSKKTEDLISPASKNSATKKKINHHHHHHNPIKNHADEQVCGINKMSKAWSMGSLMEDLPISPSSFNGDSPTLPCDSARPSNTTIFYSPTRFQDMKSSNNYSNMMKKQFPNSMNISSSFESAKNIGFLEEVEECNELENSIATYEFDESSIGVNDINSQVLFSVPPTVSEEGGYLHKRGTASARYGEFGGAIPVLEEDRKERRLSHRPKSYQDFLDETRTHKQKAEIEAMKKASYTYLLRKLTKKEAAIDEWELNRKTKAELQLDKLEKKLEQKRAEAVQKLHKKLAEIQQDAHQRKAKARRSALKEMAKHCSSQQLN